MALRKLRKNANPEPKAGTGGSQVQTELDRPTADEIYEQVSRNARHELDRSAIGLLISGLAGGITMGLTALSTSIVIAELGPSPAAKFIADLLYPIGFIAVILGRAQLFTENTLYPVALMLAERRHGWKTLRLWAIVLPSNVLGAFLFALLAVRTGALRPEFVTAMTRLGVDAAERDHEPRILERRNRRLDHRAGRLAGQWQPLHHRLRDADLVVDVCRGTRRICPLHCHQRRNFSGRFSIISSHCHGISRGLHRRRWAISAAACCW